MRGGLYQTNVILDHDSATPGNRPTKRRMALLKAAGMNLRGKSVLDFASNFGMLLIENSAEIAYGVGLELDPIRVNEANLHARAKGLQHLALYTFGS